VLIGKNKVKRKSKTHTNVFIWGMIVLFSQPGLSMVMVGGSDPIEDHGWPTGSLELANLPTRISWMAGPPFGTGSMYEFRYHCKHTDQFNDALKAFASIQADKLEVVIHNGTQDGIEGEIITTISDDYIDWTFTVWNPQDWDRLKNTSRSFYRLPDSETKKPVPFVKDPLPAPRIDVHLGGGAVIWSAVKIPQQKNLIVIDKRPGTIAQKFAGRGLVQGKVFDLETKKPIPGAQIVLAKRQGQRDWKDSIQESADKKGVCQIGQIPLGMYQIRIQAQGYVATEMDFYDNRKPEIFEFESGMLRPFTVKGKIVDVTGNPLKDLEVRAGDFVEPGGNGYPAYGDGSAITNAQGEFEIRNLPKGFASLCCRVKGLYQQDSIFELYPVPGENIILTMTGTGTVRGKVIDEAGKSITDEVHIIVRPPGEQIGKWGGSSRCASDGSFEFTNVPPGEYLVGTDHTLYTDSEKANAKLVVVKAGKIHEVEVKHISQRRKRK
jgi:hypothetical protein